MISLHWTTYMYIWTVFCINTLRPRQNGRHFADDMFKCIFLNENVWIPIEISLKCVPKVPINNIPSLVQIMAWRRSGDKSLSEPMMDSLLTHICVTRPQWAKSYMGQVTELWLSCYLVLLSIYQVTRQPQFHDLTHMYQYNVYGIKIAVLILQVSYKPVYSHTAVV